jgi:hypothetical protein
MTTGRPFVTNVEREGTALLGPWRAPRQLLQEQEYGGHASIHDEETAGALGLAGAPIEGPTHFSQFDPLGYELFADAWFERGCLSAHFETMVVDGERVQARVARAKAAPGSHATGPATGEAFKASGERVLVASLTVDDTPTELDARLSRARARDPGELRMLERVTVGWRAGPWTASVTFDEANGALYPFSLTQKLAVITEPSPWYERGGASPWGRPLLPTEMLSVLVYKEGAQPPVRQPAVGLFVDLEVRRRAAVFADQDYAIAREVVAVGQSRRVESFWTRSTVQDDSGAVVAEVLLHEGFFKREADAAPADGDGPPKGHPAAGPSGPR